MFKQNQKFFKNNVTSDEIWTPAGTREMITLGTLEICITFFHAFKFTFTILVVQILVVGH